MNNKYARRWSFQDGRGVGRYFPNVDKLSWQAIGAILAVVLIVSTVLSLPQFLGFFAEENHGHSTFYESSSSSDGQQSIFQQDESLDLEPLSADEDSAAVKATAHTQRNRFNPAATPGIAKVSVIIAARDGFPRETVQRFCSITGSEVLENIVPVQVLVVMFSTSLGDPELTTRRAQHEATCLRKVRGARTDNKAINASAASFSLLFIDERPATSSLAEMYNAGMSSAVRDASHFVFLEGAVAPMESATHFLNRLIAPMLVPMTRDAQSTDSDVSYPQIAGCCIVDPARDTTVSKGYEVSFQAAEDESSALKKVSFPLLTRRYSGFPMYDDRNYLVDDVGIVGPHCVAATRTVMRKLKGFRWKFPTREDLIRRGELSFDSFSKQLVTLHSVYLLCSDSVRMLSIKEIQTASGPERALVRTVSAGSVRLQSSFKSRFGALNMSDWQLLAMPTFERMKKERDAYSTDKFSRFEFVGAVLEREENLVDMVLSELASEEELGVDLSFSVASLVVGDRIGIDPSTGEVKPLLSLGLVVSTNATATAAHRDPLSRVENHSNESLPGRLLTLTMDLLSTVLRTRSSFGVSPIVLRNHGPVIEAIYTTRGAMTFDNNGSATIKLSELMNSLQSRKDGSMPVSRLRVYWEIWCCKCCGFTTELTSYLVGARRGFHVEASIGPQCFCDNNIAYVADQLEFAHSSNMMPLLETDALVMIHHRAPNSIHSVTVAQELITYRPDYRIVRCMYEFSRIPADWVNVSNDDSRVNELWVPGQSVRQAFVDSGVRAEKISILPEAVDVHFFDPAVHRPFLVETLPSLFGDGLHCNTAGAALLNNPHVVRPYIFFSQFKWEPRKGWDVLLQAWAQAFPSSSSGLHTNDALLLMLVNLFIVDGVNATDRFNYTYMHNAANAMLQETMGIGLDSLPPLCFLVAEITDEELARLFRTADAFVLPTRGEGWCLPAMQAMSMGLPALVTGYGGQLEFMTHNDNSLLIEYKLVSPPKNFYYQHADDMEWAEPSTADLTHLMQFVWSHPRAGATIGRRAREHISTHFSEEAVGKILHNKLLDVQRKIGPRRLPWDQRKRKEGAKS
jgi:glycosyltransferase involved in cell wall biosynthesis